MIYITGDTHGKFSRIKKFCYYNNTSKKDIMIILGDACINYLGDNDCYLKKELSEYPITFFCIHGNHENRPQNITSYQKIKFFENNCMYEKQYPNIIFPIDGNIYNINNNNVLVIGGAYSVDKWNRIVFNKKWFSDEQPSDIIKKHTEDEILKLNGNINYVLSHTCPRKYEPIEWFIKGLDESSIDHSTEDWLEKIYNMINKKSLNAWYCGHFHGDKKIDKMIFMFETYMEFMK